MNETLRLFALVAIVACSRDDSAGTDTAAADLETPVASGGRVTNPASWSVEPRGFGPLRTGMSLASAKSLLGESFREPAGADTAACEFVTYTGGPTGILIMLERGEIARIDVTGSNVGTDEGARVGDSEERIRTLYGARVTESPHKYTDGHYLTVRPAAPEDSAHRLLFETDGRVVTRYRAGRMPAVELVEGCA